MKYRELLELYKKGELDDAMRREIEADIERQDAISEYLYDSADVPEFSDLDNTHDEGAGSDEFTAVIRRTIRRSFIKMGITVGAVVLVSVLSAQFLLPKAVDKLYYDPTEIIATSKVGNMETDRMSLDMAVYSELFMPSYYRNEVIAESEGYGKYAITIPQIWSVNGKFTAVNGSLNRGKLTLYDTNTLRTPTGNAFMPPEGSMNYSIYKDEKTGELVGPAGTVSDAKENLLTLDGRDWFVGYISLKNVTDYEEFYNWFVEKNFDYNGDLWCRAYGEYDDGVVIQENIGFMANAGGRCLDWDREKYPYLSMLDNDSDEMPDESDGEVMKTHFLSLMRYLKDNEEIGDMLQSGSTFACVPMINAVERDGLRVSGFAITCHPDTLIELSRDAKISYVYAEELR